MDEEQKDDLFTTSDAAVNPMFSGAGTNLKTLEFLSAGIPMLSTYVGVRGLDLEEGVHYVHAEKDDFVQKLKELLQNERQQETLSRKGKEFINSRYSWEKICDDVHQAIETPPINCTPSLQSMIIQSIGRVQAEKSVSTICSSICQNTTVLFMSA